jgi:hypothetical protein
MERRDKVPFEILPFNEPKILYRDLIITPSQMTDISNAIKRNYTGTGVAILDTAFSYWTGNTLEERITKMFEEFVKAAHTITVVAAYGSCENFENITIDKIDHELQNNETLGPITIKAEITEMPDEPFTEACSPAIGGKKPEPLKKRKPKGKARKANPPPVEQGAGTGGRRKGKDFYIMWKIEIDLEPVGRVNYSILLDRIRCRTQCCQGDPSEGDGE